MINIIAAIGQNRELGKENKLLWSLPTDMKYFRETTIGKTIVMGKNTYLSIGRPLPGRKNIVLSTSLKDDRVEICSDVNRILTLAKTENIFIIGGAKVYQDFLPYADNLYLTLVDDAPKADVYFPYFNEEEYEQIVLSEHFENNLNFKFVLYRRKNEKR